MPEKYRALLVILILASAVFAFAKPLATAVAMSKEDFSRRRNYWFYITIVAFLAPHFWVFAIIVGILIYKAVQQETNKVALYAFLFLALPQIPNNIPGFGIIDFLFKIDYLKICQLIILLPVCLHARRLALKSKGPVLITDYILLSYIALTLLIKFQYETPGGIVRAVISWSMDVAIPYYAISRSVRSLKDFRDVLMSFVIAAMLAAVVGVFEFSKMWLLYSTLGDAWGVPSIAFYLSRADLLRANATSGHAIVLGYVLAVAIGFYVYLKGVVPSSKLWYLGLLLLAAGEISPLSKGPWVGVAVIVLVLILLSPARLLHATKLLLGLPVVAIALVSTEVGNKVIGFLPFVGTLDEGSATYRQLLFDTSVQIVLDNPWFGSTDFLDRMEALRQGQGIIDLVNTYLIVALNTGLVGLSLFISFFVAIMWGMFRAPMASQANPELLALRNCLLAAMSGILIIISTCSPIFHVTTVYVIVFALGIAFRVTASNASGDADFQKTRLLSSL